MTERVAAKTAYFSLNPDNPLVRSHVGRGGIAAIYDQGYLWILQHNQMHRIEAAEQVPLTMGGKAPFMIANALAGSLAAFVQGVTIEQIRTALQSFRASAEQTPGRMNLFNLGHFHALVDYAHNPAGYQAVGGFVQNWVGPAIGVVGGPGDRRDEDLRELGTLSASIFDEIIVKEDDDTRGRPRGEAATLIVQGIHQGLVPGQDLTPHSVRLSETEAIEWALDHAPENGLVVIFPESVSRAIALINARNPVSDGEPASLSTEALQGQFSLLNPLPQEITAEMPARAPEMNGAAAHLPS
jgi:cyanophycin synthetase